MQTKQQAYMLLHSDLVVGSMDVSLSFYCNKLGFSLVEDVILRGHLVQEVSGGIYDAMRVTLIRVSRVGAMIELQEFLVNSTPAHEALTYPLRHGCVSILVSDLDAHIRRVMNEGLSPTSDIFTVSLPGQGNCRIVFYKDPDGNRLEFVQVLS